MTTPSSSSSPLSGYLPPAVVGGPARITVACIDMAATHNLASYVADYSLQPSGYYLGSVPPRSGRIRDAAQTRADLVDDLVTCIRSGRSVALGIEAPLWGALDLPLGPCHERFAKEHAWYMQAGGAVAAQAALMVPEMLAELARQLQPSGIQLSVTYGQKGQPAWQPDTLLLWELYNVGAAPGQAPGTSAKKQKCCAPSKGWTQDQQDACCGVEHGFVNFKQNATSSYVAVQPSGERKSLVGARLFAHGLVPAPSVCAPLSSPPFWDDGCIVVEPSPIGGAAEQLWP